MTEPDRTAHAELGAFMAAASGFFRSAVPNRVGETTVQLICGVEEWERLLATAAVIAARADQ